MEENENTKENEEFIWFTEFEKIVITHSYEQLTSNNDGNLKVFSHIVLYKALDYNIKIVFNHVISIEKKIFLRMKDVKNLI
jgi:hypothetical protein